VSSRRAALLVLTALAAAPALASAAEPARTASAPRFAQLLLPEAAGGGGFVEPRVAVAPDGAYVATTSATRTGDQVVFRSTDGGRTWPRTATNPTQRSATPDVEVVTTRTGRLVTVELEGVDQALALQTSYSDDGGRTWKAGTSFGSPADTDRPWLAVGPDDPATKQPRVYLTWHNLASGLAVHEILVATSTDGGATFGAPVPVTLPGEQAFLDLQCGDGYPSSVGVDPVTGQVHVAFGTRTSAAGGCGAQPVQFNIVTPTRVWVASSPNGSPGSWTQNLAVDRSRNPGTTLPAIFSPLALDRAGNAYVVFTESATPDLVGAVRYVWSPPGARSWSAPVTVATPAGGAVVPHVQAGDAGRVAFTWYGSSSKAKDAEWSLFAAVTPDARVARPSLATSQVSRTVLLRGRAADLVGQCTSGNPASGIVNGLTCGRAPDNYGTAVDARGRIVLTYPGHQVDDLGTYVAVQRGGTLLRR
jgi:hypothetical protein